MNSPLAVFTDGSCIRNGFPDARGAYACVWPEHPAYDVGIALPPDEVHTNNRAEYRALLHALVQADEIGPLRNLVVYTDSQLMINSFTKWIGGWKRRGWKKADGKPVANVDLLMEIDEKMKHRNVTFHHVRAHTGTTDTFESFFNDKVDRLARASVRPTSHPPPPSSCRRRPASV